MAAKDRIFWSDANKRPLVGPDKGEQIPSQFQFSDRVSTRANTTRIRIEVADFAYAFSNIE